MKRIVLDCNCLLLILPKKSNYRLIWDKVLIGEISLCVTTEILNEYSEILAKLYSQTFSDSILNVLINLENVEKIEVFYRWNLITSDYDDNKYVDCAISANANCIVTEDKHFNPIKKLKFPKVDIQNIDEYMAYFS